MSNDEIAELTWVAKYEAANYIKRNNVAKHNIDDAYRHALLGLLFAGRRCDKSKKGWNNYITTRIRGAIIDGFREESPLTRGQQKELGTYQHVYLESMTVGKKKWSEKEVFSSAIDDLEARYDVAEWLIDDVCGLFNNMIDRTLVRMRISGYQFKEIAEKVSRCESWTIRRFQSLAPVIRRYFDCKS